MASSINSDLLLEILTRISLQDLGKIRTINKEWNTLTYEPRFTNLHPKRTKTVLGYLVQGIDYGNTSVNFALNAFDSDSDSGGDGYGDHGSSFNISLDFLPSPVEVLSCHDGILLCKGLHDGYCKPRDYRYYVCKPTTKEWILIPNPKTRYHEVDISIVVLKRKPLRYKIVRICDQCTYRHYVNYRCEVFNSESWRWKRMEDINLPWNLFFARSDNAVVVSGIAYKLMLPVLEDECSSIFAFDLYHEKWELIRFPNPIPSDSNFAWSAKLVNYEGKLGLLCVRSEDHDEVMHVWVMNKEGIWGKKHTACINKFMEGKHAGPLALFNNDVVVMGGYNYIVFCKLSNKKMTVVPTDFMMCKRLSLFCSDFEPCYLYQK